MTVFLTDNCSISRSEEKIIIIKKKPKHYVHGLDIYRWCRSCAWLRCCVHFRCNQIPILKCAAVKTRPDLEIVLEEKKIKAADLSSCVLSIVILLVCVQASSPDAGCASNCAVASHSCAETPFRSGHSCRA